VFAIGYVVVYPSVAGRQRCPGGLFELVQPRKSAIGAGCPPERAEAGLCRSGRDRHHGASRQAGADEPGAIAGGAAAFKVHCVQCHGSGAAGAKGYPNLNDDEWLWGGDLATIEKTIADGIRQPGHDATRMSQMPAFGRDGILQPAQIEDVVSYVRTLSGQEKGSASSARGQALFTANCAVCHGPDGKGSRTVGAPNLTDAIWLYGGDRATIAQTVTNSRYGVMPAWSLHLDKVTIRMLAAYVHSLGGGEAAPAPVSAPEQAADAASAAPAGAGNVGG
jgi:cytochrome c oxidase cbb3-type subunit 3